MCDNMSKRKEIKLFNPVFIIKKNPMPIIFIDTFMWNKIIKNDELTNLIIKCCRFRKLIVTITSLQKGELHQRNFLEKIEDLCGDQYLVVPSTYICANQIVHSMISYYKDIRNVELGWKISISKVSIIKPPINPKKIITDLVYEVNKMRNETEWKNKGYFISTFVQIEREIWMKNLQIYWESISKLSKKHNPNKSYEEFFYSDYFTDLPHIILMSYLFGYILKEREIKIQDVIDIYNVSEIVPYTMLSIIDKDQYNRLLTLKKDYPFLFENLFRYVHIASYHNKAPNPEITLKEFLEWCLK